MAVHDIITDHIGIWTSTIKTKSSAGRGNSKKLDLYGIKKLRELILELAVRGKLVPQNPNDEPAIELLKRIETEKAKLVKKGKIRKQKVLSPISGDEKKFELPMSWELQRFGTLLDFSGGSQPPKSTFSEIELDGYVQLIQIRDLGPFPQPVYVPKELVSKFCTKQDVMIGRYGASVGKVFWGRDGAYNVALIKLHNDYQSYENSFLFLLMKSPVGQNLFSGISRSAQAGFSKGDIENQLIPLPSINEQHRIVAKVDELMVLCDQLETQTEASIDAHKTLVEVLLATLTNAKDGDELNDNWQRISQHFDVLFTTEASIDQLKQTILQLAVMGKLVKQDPNDEPASKLLERIATEKARLIKDGKIKKQKPLPVISDEEKPFELPSGWGFVRLDDICAWVTSGSTPPKPDFHETEGVPFLKVYNIRTQKIDFEYKQQFINSKCHGGKLKRSTLYPGDVVMNIVGPPLGKIAIIPDTYPEWNCNQAIVFFRPVALKLNSFLYTYLTAHTFLDYIELIGTAGQDNISVTKSRTIVFPVPPLGEQHRIVAKVDKLMALCDALKTSLNEAQTTQLHLTDSIVEQGLS
jgi:type I restriction enzyme S subunit